MFDDDGSCADVGHMMTLDAWRCVSVPSLAAEVRRLRALLSEIILPLAEVNADREDNTDREREQWGALMKVLRHVGK